MPRRDDRKDEKPLSTVTFWCSANIDMIVFIIPVVVTTASIPVLSSLSLPHTITYTHALAFFPGIRTSDLSSLGRLGQNVSLTLV